MRRRTASRHAATAPTSRAKARSSARFDHIVADFGRLDGLVNNAGILRDAMLVKAKDGDVTGKMTLEQWQAVIDVNLTGVFLCGREAAERMIQLGNGGVIVNISSISRAGNAGQSQLHGGQGRRRGDDRGMGAGIGALWHPRRAPLRRASRTRRSWQRCGRKCSKMIAGTGAAATARPARGDRAGGALHLRERVLHRPGDRG